MDIDEYLKKKKELEKKKEILEAKNELDKKKVDIPKKEIEIRRRREITPIEDDGEPSVSKRRLQYNDYPSDRGSNIKWAVLGLAFFVALLVVGFFFMSNYIVVQTNSKAEEKSSDVEDLQKKIDALQKTIEDNTEENTSGSKKTNETENVTEEYSGPGPDFEIYLMDEHEDAISLGSFDSAGKVKGKIIELWAGAAATAKYEYRLFLKNKEQVNIQCVLDELIEIDSDEDGEVDETKYDNKLAVLELGGAEQEIMKRSVSGIGLIKGEYEASCYFCQDNQCDAIMEGGETKSSAIFKILIHAQSYGNQTNST